MVEVMEICKGSCVDVCIGGEHFRSTMDSHNSRQGNNALVNRGRILIGPICRQEVGS